MDLNKLNEFLNTPLGSNRAFAVKTYEGKWYTVYTISGLEKVISEGNFENIVYRRTA